MTAKLVLNHVVRLFVVCAAFALAACGSSDNTIVSPPPGNGGGPVPPPPAQAAALAVSASVTQLPADGSATALITALAVDSNNNVVQGVPISFAATSGALVVNSSVTDTNGVATATLGLGGDTSNRIIAVTATSGNLSAAIAVQVVGTSEPVRTITAVELSTNQARLPTDGSVTATITATVLGAGSNVVPNVPVSFEADSGVLVVTRGVTDAQGRAQATVSIGTNPLPRTITVSATAGEITNEIALQVVAGVVEVDVADLLLFVTPDSLLAGSTDTALISLIAVDAENNAVPGVPVTFGASDGVLTSIDTVTDAGGRAQAVFQPVGIGAGMVEISVTAAGLTRSVNIEIVAFEPVASVSLRSSAGFIASDGSTSANISAQVLDANNRAVEGVPVTFAADSGAVVVTRGVTDAQGFATATLSAGTNPAERTITVSASAGGRSASLPVQVVTDVTEPAAMILSTNTVLLPADGSQTSTLTALVLDANNNALAGIPVSFAANSGALVVGGAVTDANGVATATLSTGGDATNRVISVTASSGVLSESVTVEVVGTFEPVGTVTAVQLSSDTQRLPTDGSVTATVTAVVLGPGNNVVPGVPVSFQVDSGVLVVTRGLTDAQGRAEATVSIGNVSTPRTITLTATAGTVTSTLPLEVVEGVVDVDVADLVVTVNPASLLAGSSDSSLITVIALDSNNNTVPGVPVSFGASDGVLTAIVSETSGTGRAQAVFQPVDVAAGMVEISVTAAGLTRSAFIDIVSFEAVASVTLSTSATLIATDNSTSAVLTAQVLDENNRAVPGIPVTFAADSGALIVTQGTTDAQGFASATLSAGTNSSERTITVSASAGSQIASTAIQVSANPLRVDSLVLVSNTDTLPTDGSAGATLTAIVRDGANNVLAGIPVSFSADSGALTVLDGSTNTSGEARVQLGLGGDPTPRAIVVTASAGGISATATISVVDQAAAAATLYLLSDVRELLSDGTGEALLTAVLVDFQNNVLPGVAVSFSASSGAIQGLDSVTGEDGTARARLTIGGDPNLRFITATAEAAGLSGTVDVRVVNTLFEVNVAEVQVLSSRLAIPSAGDIEAEITAIVRDAGRNVLAGVPVAFTATSGSLRVITAETDENGIATALLSTGANPTNRTITVTGSAAGLSDSVDVDVTGTTLSVVGPENLVVGDEVSYLVELRDSAGTGLPGRDITVTSSLGNFVGPAMGQTDTLGKFAFDYVATNPGTDLITVVSSDGSTRELELTILADEFRLELVGVVALPDGSYPVPVATPRTVRVTWRDGDGNLVNGEVVLTTTRGRFGSAGAATTTVNLDIEDGVGQVDISAADFGPATITATAMTGGGPATSARVNFFASNPTQLVVQAWPSTLNPATDSLIEAVVYSSVYDAVRDEFVLNRVRDQVVAFQISDPTGGSLSAALAKTNASGIARVTYTAGNVGGASQGVLLTAVVQANPAIWDQATLTVVERQAFITLGTDNLLQVVPQQYIKTYVIQVTDIQGNAVAGVPVQARVRSTNYFKGGYVLAGTTPDRWLQVITRACLDEDTNRNGILDDDLNNNEDVNGSGALEAGNVATVVGPVGGIVTDENGFARIEVTYPQNFASWVAVELAVETVVSGTEHTRAVTFILPPVASAINNTTILPPFYQSPYNDVPDCPLF